jgi:hypothetical protein
MTAAAKFGAVRPTSEALIAASPAFATRHFSPKEIAEMWCLSVDSVRKLFEKEPDVLVLGNAVSHHGKRSYTTLRIPVQVVERVHRRLRKV